MSVCNELNIISRYLNLVKFIQSDNMTDLKQSADNDIYRGTCVFCNTENKLVINNEKNFFYCFECHSGGDSVAFLCKKYDKTPAQLAEKVKGPVFDALSGALKENV